MFCATGSLGYLEKSVPIKGQREWRWAAITNADKVSEAACYRYVADLDREQ